MHCKKCGDERFSENETFIGQVMTMEDMHIQNGTLELYTGREEILIIPEGIHTIGEGALKGCSSLKKVILPGSLRRILGGAFKGCRKLEEVEIPEGVNEIGAYAFHRCHALRKIILPSAVEVLGDCAFLYCDSLEEARIPGVRRLGTQAFVNDVQLKKLTLSGALEEDCLCDVFTGCGLLTDFTFADGRHFVIPNAVEALAGNMVLPGLIRKIAADILRMMRLEGRTVAEFLTNLKHVEIPEGVERIGKSAFFDKRGILSVKLPGSLKEIESRAFRNCIGLEAVSFEGDGLLIHEDAFKNCTSLKYILTPDGIRHELKGIARPSGTEVPELVKTIHRQVLGNFRISGTILLKYLGAESRVAVPEGITAIAEEAFAGNETIDRVILPDGLLEIGSGAFRDCLLLQTIVIPQGLRRIGSGAFENCVKLLRIELPQTVSRLEKGAFKRCRALREVNLGGNLEQVEEQVFFQCRCLEKITFPDTLTSIGGLAFYRCRSLREVKLSAKVAQVGSLAFAESGVERVRMAADGRSWGSDIFSGCDRLRELVLEEGVSHIPDRLAKGCAVLEQVILPGSLASAGVHVWERTPFLESWIQEGRKGEIFWDGENLQGEVRLPENVRILAGGAFYGNRDIAVIHLPESVKWVGPRAFDDCGRLRRVFWHSPVDRLEEAVFADCSELESVEDAQGRPVAWRSIGGRAFFHCRSLKKICLRQTESIGAETFCGCTGLQWSRDCAMPSGVLRKIGERAFEATVLVEESGKRGFEETALVEENGKRGFEETALVEENGKGGFEEAAFAGKNGKCIAERNDLTEGHGGEPAVFGNIVISGADCSGEIVLPEGITGIAPFAFSGNRRITGIVLPGSLTWIGEGAFWACSGLREVRFPIYVCEIGARAFEKCTSLSRADLRADILGNAAFAYCTSLVNAVLSGVTVLPARLFEGCALLRTCVCENAERIGEHCFSGCVGLTDFDSWHIYETGEYAFEGCDSLRRVELAEGACIMPHGFEDCGRLEEISLVQGAIEKSGPARGQDCAEGIGPAKRQDCAESISCVRERGCAEEGDPDRGQDCAEGIGPARGRVCLKLREYAFSGCTRLSRIRFQGEQWEFHAYEDLLSDQIPETVRLIFHSAFSCFAVEQESILCGYRGAGRILNIPRGIRRIEAEVFRDVMMLEEVTISETVEYIGARAFHGTAWMDRRKQDSPFVTVNRMLLDASGCAGEVTVPEDIKMVCGWAFANGMKIEKIRFLSGRIRVGEYAFRNCINLREIILPDNSSVRITGIADRGRELPDLAAQAVMDSLNCFKTDEADVLVECTGNISVLRIPEGVTAIGAGVFRDGNLLTEVTFPRSVTSVGDQAFSGCKWLREVCRAHNVEEIGNMAFFNCGALERIECSEKLRRIGARAFENCTSLQEILIPEGVEEIPEKAFYRCHSLKRVELPSTVKRIGREAFAFCRNLSQVHMPQREAETAVITEERAFVGCGAAVSEYFGF